MASGLKRSLTALLLCAAQVALAADPLPDPTRPAIDLNDTGSGGVVEVVPEEASRGLQSILISPQYRAAIINGETVQLGNKTGDSRLVEVRENSVVLENSQGRRVVELFPKVSIKKNVTAQQNNAAQENASVRTSLPENAAGGAK